MKHGGRFSSFNDPTLVNFGGFFGKMFPHLPAYDPAGNTDDEKVQSLLDLANEFFDSGTNNPDNPSIPAAYTYFGQFVDHDITFDTISRLDRVGDPRSVENFRTPSLELDSVYGGGPEAMPFLYNGATLVVGNTGSATGNEPDLQRNINGRALIVDPRNDENFLVSQIHLAFVKFHNRVAEELKANHPDYPESKIFEEARRIVTWHYQWVVINDFVKRLSLASVFNEKKPNLDGGPLSPESTRPNLRFLNPDKGLFMPVEFSVAVFRLGHSMVRPAYNLNDHLGPQEIPIFTPGAGGNDLRGFRPLPQGNSVQWNKFLEINGSTPQLSKKLDNRLSEPLMELPNSIVADMFKNLAARNLIRSFRLQLPSGQDIARAIGVDDVLSGNDPLWVYILKEAMQAAGDGTRLSRVGTHILTEVFFAMLAADPRSYLNLYPRWTPADEPLISIPHTGEFELKHIIQYAGMPVTLADVQNQL